MMAEPTAAQRAERERLRALYAHLRAAAAASDALPGWRRTERLKLLALEVAVEAAQAGDTSRDWRAAIACRYAELTEAGQDEDCIAAAWLRAHPLAAEDA